MSRLGRTRLVVAGYKPPLQSMIALMGIPENDPSLFEQVPPNCQSAASYEELAAALESNSPDDLARTVCVVTLTAMGVSSWNVVDDSHPMRPTWLMWRFPEVYWIFLVDDESFDRLSSHLAGRATVSLHLVRDGELDRVGELATRHAEGLRTWFDPAGVRSAAIEASVPSDKAQQARVGLVMDEELAFATFNGYLLYRLGIPTWMVPTGKEFLALRGIGVDEMKGRKFVILEDVELNYADIEAGSPDVFRPVSDRETAFASRLEHWNLAKDRIEHQVFVSSSLVEGEANVVKPLGGLYERGILDLLNPTEPVWVQATATGHHSAPGALQAIAECLLVRVRKQLTEDNDSVAAIHGSLLAYSAERLLGGRTYTMALECLTLRHAFEAQAECGFPGASDELEVGKRIQQLRRSIYRLVFKASSGSEVLRQLKPGEQNSTANRRKLRKRCIQTVSGMLESLGMLREVFGYHKKLEEEEAVLQSIRWWRIGWFVLQDAWTRRWAARTRNPLWRAMLRWGERLVRGALGLCSSYFTLVLRPTVLAGMIASWIVLFGLCYRWLAAENGLSGIADLGLFDWIRHSAVTFLAMQQGLFGDPKWSDRDVFADITSGAYGTFWNITVLEMALGYFHMGLLVATLVQRITRR